MLGVKEPADVLLDRTRGGAGEDARPDQLVPDAPGEDHVIIAPVQVAVALSLVPQLLDRPDELPLDRLSLAARRNVPQPQRPCFLVVLHKRPIVAIRSGTQPG